MIEALLDKSARRVLLGLALYAASCVTTGDELPKQYDIELLIFQNLGQDDGGEVWPTDYSGWLDEPGPTAGANDSAAPAVTWLPESSHRLTAEYNTLRRSSRYRPLAYLAWRQPVLGRHGALPLPIPVQPTATGGYVDGTVRVAVERYLHLYLDLQLHLPAEPGSAADSGPEGGSPAIRLTEQRRMRSKEIHYFDNPRFGVIALITPYEPPPESADTDPVQVEEGAATAGSTP